jgi:hypothetical protein
MAVALLSNSLAPSTNASYDSALIQFFILCTKENFAPLQATPATMVRYTVWLAVIGTVAASSLQPYFSAVKKFFRDHQRQPIPRTPSGRSTWPRNATTPLCSDRLPLTACRPRRTRHSTYIRRSTRHPHVDSCYASSSATFQGMLSCLRQLHLFLPRRNWCPLSNRRPNCRQTFTAY